MIRPMRGADTFVRALRVGEELMNTSSTSVCPRVLKRFSTLICQASKYWLATHHSFINGSNWPGTSRPNQRNY